MLILGPKLMFKMWGGERLHDYGADKNETGIAMMYTMSANDEYDSEILNGPYKGQTLHQVFKEHKELFGYDKYGDLFPLMVDFIDAQNGNLSIQTHPIDSYAQEHLNMPFGKTESWFFIIPPESGKIYCGSKVKTMKEVEEKVAANEYKDIIDEIETPAGSYVYIEAGTLHAISTGSFVYEIQQAHDVTYRFWDYDRLVDGKLRELQTELAMKNLRPELDSKAEAFNFDEIKEEKCYALMRKQLKDGSFKNPDSVFACVTMLEGEIKTEEGETIKKGTSFVLAPGEEFSFTGEAEVMVAWPR